MPHFEDDSKLPTDGEISNSNLQQAILDRIVKAVTAQLQDSYDVEVTSFRDPLNPFVYIVQTRVGLEKGEKRNLVYSVAPYELFGFSEDTRDSVVENHVRRIVSTIHRAVHALKQRA
nr:MAG TPA: hypothetical protein [Caudoviricetes sp.]